MSLGFHTGLCSCICTHFNIYVVDFYEQWLLCEIRLEGMGESNIGLVADLLQGMNTRLNIIFNNNPAFYAALFLDLYF